MGLKETAFILINPRLAFQTIYRQSLVVIEHAQPPHTSTIEEFPVLPLYSAMKKIQEAKGEIVVDHIIWSRKDRERMNNGALPTSYPEHNL